MDDPRNIEPVSLEELKSNSGPRSIPLVIILGAAVAAAFILHSTPLQSANDRSRWCTVYSLVELGTWQIDEIDATPGWSTIDKVRHNDHFYSSKPALMQSMVAGVYWCVKQVTGWNLKDETEETTRVILLIVNLIPVVIAWLVMNGMLVRYAKGKYTKRILLIAFIFATPITTFLVTLNNHTAAACAIVFALSPALRILIDGRTEVRYYLAAGFFAALTFTFELPALSFVGLLGLLLLKHNPGRTLKFFLPAALIPLVAAVATTYWQTGGWKPFYAYYGTEKYVYTFEGIPSYWSDPKSLDKAPDSFPVYFLHCTFGHHGIFSLTPLFLLMIPGWLAPKWSGPKFRWVVWMTALLTVVVLGFYLSRTENYNYGGNTSTLRWLMWLIPLWTLGLIPLLDRFGETRWLHVVAGLFLAVGCFSTYWPIENPWTPPWMFALLDRYDLLDQYDDPVPELDRTHYVWFSRLPVSQDPANPESITLSGWDHLGHHRFIRLADGGQADGLQTLLVEDSLFSNVPQRREIVVDVEKFEAGKKISEWLIFPDDDAPEQRAELIRLLRGVPGGRPYNRGRIRYLRTRLRTDAFTVHHAAVSGEESR
ncbi:MAG TPA: hypothetical protein VLA12_05850, partial [Planctomycetaceae bacterium]|nr:hypothetical protein [Planctomycetaceae bacterium]